MKKMLLFFVIIIVILAVFAGMYINYKMNYSVSKRENLEYEYYTKRQITVDEMTTLINKAIDANENNGVEKDKKGIYINNNTNSINIEIEFLDNQEKLPIEYIYNGDVNKFFDYYRGIKFECTQIQYHKDTNKVKYMCFRQVNID